MFVCTRHCRNQEVLNVPMKDPEMVVLVTNSNYRHSLGEGVDKEYEKRRQTCESAAKKLGKDLLRDLTLEELEGQCSHSHTYTHHYGMFVQLAREV